jgi:hypothetical protein
MLFGSNQVIVIWISPKVIFHQTRMHGFGLVAHCAHVLFLPKISTGFVVYGLNACADGCSLT